MRMRLTSIIPGDFGRMFPAAGAEVGEWADDPLVVQLNATIRHCGNFEVGDPLEGEANYGGPYPS